MAYYLAGDYYMSGRGDPFLGGLIKGIGKVVGGVAKFAGGVLPGPLGGIARTVGGVLTGGAPQPSPVQMWTGTIPTIRQTAQQVPAPGFGAAVSRAVPGGATGMQPCAPGYHVHKTEGNRCVKNRRMNPANPQALRRAIRREGAFIALAKRTLKGSGYTFKRTGVARPRKRRRR